MDENLIWKDKSMVLSIKLNVVFGPSFEYRNLNRPKIIWMFKKWYSANQQVPAWKGWK